MADKADKTRKMVPTAPKITKGGIIKWWRETIGELRRVSWPTFPDARRLTIIVLIVMFVMSAFLGLLDFIFSFLVERLITL